MSINGDDDNLSYGTPSPILESNSSLKLLTQNSTKTKSSKNKSKSKNKVKDGHGHSHDHDNDDDDDGHGHGHGHSHSHSSHGHSHSHNNSQKENEKQPLLSVNNNNNNNNNNSNNNNYQSYSHSHSHSHGSHNNNDDSNNDDQFVVSISSSSSSSNKVKCVPPDSKSDSQKAKKKLILASILCCFFMAGEVTGGAISGSLAIMTDAAHMLSDFAGFLISLFAIWLAQRPATNKMSFGFHRAEILGAIVSVMLIWCLTGVLVYEAVLRVIDVPDVDGKIMFVTAICGVAVNILMGLTLHQGHGHSHGDDSKSEEEEEEGKEESGGHGHSHSQNINVRAAFIHVLGDLVQSIGVLIASILIWYNPDWAIADPICTFIFSVLVLVTTIGILRDSLHVLMEGVPKGIKYDKVKQAIEKVNGVVRTHDMHIWSLTVGKPAIAVHVSIRPEKDSHEALSEVQDILCNVYGIHHTTIQIEIAGKEELAHCSQDIEGEGDICSHH